MKHFNWILRYVALFIFLLLTNGMKAQQDPAAKLGNTDSIRISLLTCRPRQNIYSLYGHTAIRYEDTKNGIDIAVNYGMFSFEKPFFVLRFVFGLTDYEMGIENFSDFKEHYLRAGCGVWQQELSLSAAEKSAIAIALEKNYEPENRVYRYNYFYDNCTTRARDIIVDNIRGQVVYAQHGTDAPSYRQMTHEYNEEHRWARFGNDLLLGVKADLPTTQAQQQFLPYNLQKDFSHAFVVSPDGTRHKLVKSEGWVLEPSAQISEKGFPLSPMECSIIFAALVLGATALEWLKNKNLWGFDIIIMAADGICGLILFAMVFSQHPTVSLNLQTLLLNPLTLVFLWHSARKLRKGSIGMWIPAWTVCIIIFFLGGFFQTYAEGIYFVASSLLIRYTLKTVQLARNKK